MPKKEANDLKIAIKSCFTMLVEDTTLIQNAATPYPVEFAFSKDWDGFAKTALFEAGGVSMAVVLSEDKCDIPGECLKKGGIPLKIAVYGVKGEERKSTGWHVTSKILFPANISVGTGGSGDPMGDEAYKQIMGIIGDPSTAGFGNKTLTEVIVEIQRSISGTASDKEVDDMLNDAFSSSDPGGSTPDNTAIADLKTLVGTLPEGAASTTVVAYITEAINALSIGDYAKTTEVTAAINTALESYYTKTQVDETFVKKTDIVMATDEEVDAMLTEVFGAQATV